jgi:hypothetical protein
MRMVSMIRIKRCVVCSCHMTERIGNLMGSLLRLEKPFSAKLVSTRASTHATGTVEIKLGFVAPPNTLQPCDFAEIFDDLVKRSRPSLVSAPPVSTLSTFRLLSLTDVTHYTD